MQPFPSVASIYLQMSRQVAVMRIRNCEESTIMIYPTFIVLLLTSPAQMHQKRGEEIEFYPRQGGKISSKISVGGGRGVPMKKNARKEDRQSSTWHSDTHIRIYLRSCNLVPWPSHVLTSPFMLLMTIREVHASYNTVIKSEYVGDDSLIWTSMKSVDFWYSE